MLKVRIDYLYLILESLDMNGDCIRVRNILDVLTVTFWLKENPTEVNTVKIVQKSALQILNICGILITKNKNPKIRNLKSISETP